MSVGGIKGIIAGRLGQFNVVLRIFAWIFTTLIFISSLEMINLKVGGLPCFSCGKTGVTTCENSTSWMTTVTVDILPWPTKSTIPVLLLQLFFGVSATICAIGARSFEQKAYIVRYILVSLAISTFFVLLFVVPKGLKPFPPPPNPNSPAPEYLPEDCITRYH